MKRNFAIKLIFVLLVAMMSFNTFAQSSSKENAPEPYTDDEFPQWALDLRRGEIITLGSLPFVTIGVTLIYGSVLYFTGQSYVFPNPFGKNGFTSDQTLQVFGISLGVSTILGITDWAIQYKKRKNYDRMQELLQSQTEKPTVQQVTPEEAHELLRQQMEKALENQDVEMSDEAQQEEPQLEAAS